MKVDTVVLRASATKENAGIFMAVQWLSSRTLKSVNTVESLVQIMVVLYVLREVLDEHMTKLKVPIKRTGFNNVMDDLIFTL